MKRRAFLRNSVVAVAAVSVLPAAALANQPAKSITKPKPAKVEVDWAAEGAASHTTYHGFSIMVGGKVIGRIMQWKPLTPTESEIRGEVWPAEMEGCDLTAPFWVAREWGLPTLTIDEYFMSGLKLTRQNRYFDGQFQTATFELGHPDIIPFRGMIHHSVKVRVG